MSESTFTELRTVFNEMDTDKSGTIDQNELKNHMRRKSKDLSSDVQIQNILQELDMDKSKSVGYTEFIAAAIDPKLVNNEKMLKGLFN